MSKARYLLKRIQSIKSTKKTTYAMKLVAAAKLKKMQDLTISSRDYEKALLDIIHRIYVESYSNSLFEESNGRNILVVVIGSSRGLCGGFNVNLKKFIERNYDLGASEFLVLGRKLGEILKFWGRAKILQIMSDIPDLPDINFSQQIIPIIIEYYRTGNYRTVEIVYTDFFSVLSLKPNSKLLLPLSLESRVKSEEEVKDTFVFEPGVGSVLDYLVPRLVEIKFLQALLESKCSEHASRMVAMDNATKNAGELVDSLTLVANKIRQASITSEILDIIGGAGLVGEGGN